MFSGGCMGLLFTPTPVNRPRCRLFKKVQQDAAHSLEMQLKTQDQECWRRVLLYINFTTAAATIVSVTGMANQMESGFTTIGRV